VAPKTAVRQRSRRERLRNLAIVFKAQIRLKIVAELYIRAMSPKRFFEEVGGTSIERVAQHFAVLEEHGWLRRVGKDRASKRPGHSETLYRATDTPFFDAETWALLPYSLRLAYSWSCFTATAKELRAGIEGAFSEGRPSRDLTCTSLELDDLGWTRVIARLADDFEAIFEEQVDAKIRSARTGEDLIRAGILQTGFELPRTEDGLALCLADGSLEPAIPFPERMAPILADDLCLEILSQLNRTDMSVKQFHREFGSDASEGAVRHRFGRLNDLAWITVVDKVKKRAAYENIWRATRPAVSTNGPWANVPESLRETEVWDTFKRFSDLVKQAIVAGSFDIRDDRHLSWCIVNLDREGWEKVVGNMEALPAFTRGEEEQAKRRIAKGGKPLTMVVGLTAIEARVGQTESM